MGSPRPTGEPGEAERRTSSAHQIASADQVLGRNHERIRLGSDRVIERSAEQLAGSWDAVRQAARLKVERPMATIDQLGQALMLHASRRVALAHAAIERDRDRLRLAGQHRLGPAGITLGDALEHLVRGAKTARKDAATRIEFCVQRIVGLGPEATLRRGYVIVRDRKGHPIGTRSQAAREPVLELEFQDGRLQVGNPMAREPGP